MIHGSLFSGIGGFDLAAEWMGWENRFHCEWNEFGKRVLKYYWPEADSHDDITKTDFTKYYGSIDILSGGFPCQPYSAAGKRQGKNDDRHLWPEMLRAIKEIAPRFVVGENVRGLTNWNGGLVFDEVCTDLENLGYQVAPFLIPASAVNAPHQRERIWFVAYREKSTRQQNTTTTNERKEYIVDNRSGIWNSFKSNGNSRNATDTESQGSRKQQSANTRWEDRRFDNNGKVWNATDTISVGYTRHSEEAGSNNSNGNGMGKKIGQNGNDFWSKIERCSTNNIRGRIQAWATFPTQSPICSGDDGLPTELDGITFSKWRNESIKGYGNAVVPQVVLQIFKAIEQYETTQRNTSNRNS